MKRNEASSECENLDAFLDDELGVDAARHFEAHLRECAACREAIDEQRWIDSLLHSSAAVQLETAPDKILESVRTSIARRRRAMLAACGLAAAAAVVIVAIGWTSLLNRQAIGPTASPLATTTVPSHPGRTATPPRATFVGGPDVIVVPVESPHPDVTIVRVYPTYQSPYAAQANVERPHAEDEFAWPDGSNGG